MLRTWFNLTWNLCRFKTGPEEFPYSLQWFFGLLFINIILAWYPLSVQFSGFDAIWRAIADVLIDVAYAYAVLNFRKRSTRFIQTSSALLSLGLAIYALTLPLVIVYPLLQQMATGFFRSIIFFIFLLIVIGLNFWGIFVAAFIYSRALDIKFGFGLLVALAVIGIEVVLLQ